MDLRIRRAPTHPFQMVFLMALSSLFVNSTPVFSHPWQASNQIERDVLQQHLESQRYLESMPFEVSSGDGEEKCVEVEQCQLCYSGEEGCAITGRRRKFECTNPSGKFVRIITIRYPTRNKPNLLISNLHLTL